MHTTALFSLLPPPPPLSLFIYLLFIYLYLYFYLYLHLYLVKTLLQNFIPGCYKFFPALNWILLLKYQPVLIYLQFGVNSV